MKIVTKTLAIYEAIRLEQKIVCMGGKLCRIKNVLSGQEISIEHVEIYEGKKWGLKKSDENDSSCEYYAYYIG